MLKSLTPDMLATDLADYLVRKGVPFRETHHISGQVVALAEKESTPMDQLSFEQLQGVAMQRPIAGPSRRMPAGKFGSLPP